MTEVVNKLVDAINKNISCFNIEITKGRPIQVDNNTRFCHATEVAAYQKELKTAHVHSMRAIQAQMKELEKDVQFYTAQAAKELEANIKTQEENVTLKSEIERLTQLVPVEKPKKKRKSKKDEI